MATHVDVWTRLPDAEPLEVNGTRTYWYIILPYARPCASDFTDAVHPFNPHKWPLSYTPAHPFSREENLKPRKNEMTGLVPQILFTVHINLNMSLETQCCSQVFPPWSKTLLVHWVLCSLPVLYLNSYFLKKSGGGGSYILSSRSEQSLFGVQFFPITLSLSRSCLILIDEGLTHVSSFPLCWCKQA